MQNEHETTGDMRLSALRQRQQKIQEAIKLHPHREPTGDVVADMVHFFTVQLAREEFDDEFGVVCIEPGAYDTLRLRLPQVTVHAPNCGFGPLGVGDEFTITPDQALEVAEKLAEMDLDYACSIAWAAGYASAFLPAEVEE